MTPSLSPLYERNGVSFSLLLCDGIYPMSTVETLFSCLRCWC